MSTQDEAKNVAAAPHPKDASRLRLLCLDLSLRMPHTHHSDVVNAARDFEKFVTGENTEATNG